MVLNIPHPPIPVAQMRVTDMAALLAAGLLLETVSRLLLWTAKAKPSKEAMLEAQLMDLRYQTAQKRALGPSAFVETAKLERQTLTAEKKLEVLSKTRRERTGKFSKVLSNLSFATYILVFVVYYTIPVLAIDGITANLAQDLDQGMVRSESEQATAYLQGFLFPLSYVGVGMRVARFGLSRPGIGALVVLWSSQTTVGKVLDGLEALLL